MTQLDFAEIVTTARAASGAAALDVPDMFEALEVLIEAYNRDGNLLPGGVIGKRAGLLRAMTNRFRLEQALRDHPEITSQNITGPIVIIGLPRSGTTKLHRMISVDPDLQKFLLWKLLNPVPLGEPDTRIALAQSFEKIMRETQAELYAAHPMAALEPDEDVFALEVTGRNYINCSTVPAPSYKKWLDGQDFALVYKWLKQYMQVLQYFDGAQGKPWVLKAPQHMGYLPLLFAAFPNATIVHCHREAAVSVASYAAMITAARKTACAVADPLDVGQYALNFWSGATARYMQDRPALEQSHPFVDLAYRDIVNDGIGCMERIYAAAKLPLTPETRTAMRAWEQKNAQHKHGKHKYGLHDAGLSATDINNGFAAYNEHFGRYF